MKIQEVILSDFRSLCRYTRDHDNFKPIPKSLLTKHWAESDEEYRNFLLDALKYYFNEKEYRKILREEIKLDEEALTLYEEAFVLHIEVQPESVEQQTDEKTVENTKENQSIPCTSLSLLL